jgi:chromosomal replication initiation ATPase DnaA
MQTVRDIVELVVKHCSKDINNLDGYYVDKTVAAILNLEEIKPYKNKSFGGSHKGKLMTINPCRLMTAQELKIAQIVCETTHTDFNDLFSRTRKRCVVEVRMQLVSFFYFYRSYTYSNLGSLFGRDHSTMIHNVTTHQDLVDGNYLYAVKFYNLINKIKEEMPYLFIEKTKLEDQSKEYAKIKLERRAKRNTHAAK